MVILWFRPDCAPGASGMSGAPVGTSLHPTGGIQSKKENWRFKRNLWAIDENGFGRAVYTVYGPERSYSLVAFSHDLPDDMRSGRVIATAWDATFALFDGIPPKPIWIVSNSTCRSRKPAVFPIPN